MASSNIAMPTVANPISTYNDLVEAVMLWADRDDTEFVNQIPNFIDFAQKEIYRTLRILPLLKEAYLRIENGIASVPSDFLSCEYMYYAKNGQFFRVTSQEEISANIAKWDTYTQVPTRATQEITWAQVGQRFFFFPQITADLPTQVLGVNIEVPENAVVIGYYADPKRLSSPTDQPYLLQIAPDALLYKTIKHAAVFTQDMQSLNTFNGLADAIINDLNDQQAEMEFSGSPLVITNLGNAGGLNASVYPFI